MTAAEEYLKRMNEKPEKTQESISEPTINEPCEKNATSSPANARIALRIVAVVLFIVLILTGTYFAKTKMPPIPWLGYTIGAIGFGLSRQLWKMGGK